MGFDSDRIRYALDGLRSRAGDIDRRQLVIIGAGLPILLVLLIVLVVVLAGGGGSLEIDEPEGIEAVADIGPIVSANPRWAGVRVVASSDDGTRTLMLMGSVPAESDLRSLKDTIEAEAGSMKVEWQVAVVPEDG